MRVSIQQAACNSLCDWLQSRLGPTIKVNDRWPEPGVPLFATPPYQPLDVTAMVTVLLAGKRQDQMLDPEFVEWTDTGKTVARWAVEACEQPIQLDVWAPYDVRRDEVLALLDDAVRAGDMRTLPGNVTGMPVADDLELRFRPEDGWEGIASVHLEGPVNDDTPDTVQQSEFRARVDGMASFILYVDAKTPRQARIRLKQWLREAETDAEPTTPLVTDVTADT